MRRKSGNRVPQFIEVNCKVFCHLSFDCSLCTDLPGTSWWWLGVPPGSPNPDTIFQTRPLGTMLTERERSINGRFRAEPTNSERCLHPSDTFAYHSAHNNLFRHATRNPQVKKCPLIFSSIWILLVLTSSITVPRSVIINASFWVKKIFCGSQTRKGGCTQRASGFFGSSLLVPHKNTQ